MVGEQARVLGFAAHRTENLRGFSGGCGMLVGEIGHRRP
jgi:hypothetical protein